MLNSYLLLAWACKHVVFPSSSVYKLFSQRSVLGFGFSFVIMILKKKKEPYHAGNLNTIQLVIFYYSVFYISGYKIVGWMKLGHLGEIVMAPAVEGRRMLTS